MDPQLLERITPRARNWTNSKKSWPSSWRGRAEREELAVAERVLERAREQVADERASAAPVPGPWVNSPAGRNAVNQR
ncbi:hypothetical protein [Streptomyces sp. NPDC006012]|uniref:hypothetical protein n=1 Tax=Streptomyces sp. NPDC006012 TaxID=3364739 RepID=UPI0036B65F0D